MVSAYVALPWTRKCKGNTMKQKMILITFTAVALAGFFSESLALIMQYDRNLIEAGQFWRLISCHFTHWTVEHAFWDITLFVVLSYICITTNLKRYCILLTASAIVVSLSVYLFNPDFIQYRGLSGIDSALFIDACISSIVKNKRILCRIFNILFLIGFTGKITYEFVTGSAIFADSGFTTLPVAHVAGAITAAAICYSQRSLRRHE